MDHTSQRPYARLTLQKVWISLTVRASSEPQVDFVRWPIMDAYLSEHRLVAERERKLLTVSESLKLAFPLPDSGSFRDLVKALDQSRRKDPESLQPD